MIKPEKELLMTTEKIVLKSIEGVPRNVCGDYKRIVIFFLYRKCSKS